MDEPFLLPPSSLPGHCRGSSLPRACLVLSWPLWGWRRLEGAQLGKQPGLACMEHAGASLLCGRSLS